MKKPEILIGIFIVIIVLAGLGYLFISDLGKGSSIELSNGENKDFPKYEEIVNPAGFVNSDEITIGKFVGNRVILLDFMTYSCINCQRTFPYLNDWYEKYKDDGLIVIGIHTPEFAFEKNIENVKKAMEKEGIKFPVVLDNDYATWSAYGNKYWPRKYLINKDGLIVYDHIGEGNYDITEAKIVELLGELNNKELSVRDSNNLNVDSVDFQKIGTPEIYLGSARIKYIQNLPDINCLNSTCDYSSEGNIPLSNFALDGKWKLEEESAVLESSTGSIFIKFSASKVNLVTAGKAKAELYLDGEFLNNISFSDSDLYNLVDLKGRYGEHLLEIRVTEGEFEAFAFTFG